MGHRNTPSTMLFPLALTTGLLFGLCLAQYPGGGNGNRNTRNIGGNEHNHHNHGGGGGGADAQGGSPLQLDADDPDFSGVVDFSNAIPGPGGSWCITKTKYVDHMVKDQIKECWHQNVTQCHDTYVTEFLPSQEQKCEESFWKSCKIDFREMPFNYTMKQCHTPLTKVCDPSPPSYGGKPKIVCKTWFESECNTTFTETTPNVEDKPNTWCKKVPRKICAPDNCRMVAGPEECNDKTLVSTVQKPTEICDLQPQQHCRLITKLTPHLISKEVCKNIPKEVCHLALTGPKMVRKPITLKWCTRKGNEGGGGRGQAIPSYRPPKGSYLPPPPPQSQPRNDQQSFPDQTFAPPTYSSPRPQQQIQSFQVRKDDDINFAAASDSVKVTKFPPGKKYYKVVDAPPIVKKRSSSVGAGSVHKSEDIFSAADAVLPKQPVFQEQFKPAASVRSRQSIQIPESFRQAVKDAGLLEEMEREGFELVEAKIEEDEDDAKALEESVEEEVDEELLDELLSNARPLPARLTPVGFTDDLGLGGDDALVGGHAGGGNDGGLGGAFGGLRR